MKRFRAIFAFVMIMVTILSFNGCSFKITSIDNLIRPPKLSGKYQGLQDAFEANIEDAFDLQTPDSGDYQSAFITHDFDADGEEEAIVFYTTKDNTDIVDFYYFEYVKDTWKPVCSFEGLGNSVDQVIFSDMNKDGRDEMIIGWCLFSSKTNKVFAVYELSDAGVKVFPSYPYTYLDVLDVNGDGRDDVFTMSIDNSIPEQLSGFARIYTFGKNNSQLLMLSEARTDGNISSYSSVSVEKVGDKNLIYVEANKGDHEMITEIVYWDDESNTLIAPLFDVSSQSTILTWRNNKIESFDIDSDGFLEIPASVEMNGSSVTSSDSGNAAAVTTSTNDTSAGLYFTKWVKFREDELKPVQYSIINEQLGYVLNIQSSWVGRITVGGRDNQWDFYRWNSSYEERGDLLFSIYYYEKSDSKSKKLYSSYKELATSDKNVFVYTITQEGYDFGVKDDTLKREFKITDFGGKK